MVTDKACWPGSHSTRHALPHGPRRGPGQTDDARVRQGRGGAQDDRDLWYWWMCSAETWPEVEANTNPSRINYEAKHHHECM